MKNGQSAKKLKKRGKLCVLRCLFWGGDAIQENAELDIDLWHAHLGRISMSNLNSASKRVEGMYLNVHHDRDHQICAGCFNV